MKKLGGIPVYVIKSTRLTDSLTNMFNNNDSLFKPITTEGTRTIVLGWKRCFFHSDVSAKAPIVHDLLDYKNKIWGLIKLYHPSGDYENDIIEFQSYYKGINGRNPNQYIIFN